MSNEEIIKIQQEKQIGNNSGGGKDIIVPDEVKNHFNWGAFISTWIWGIFNKSYITFLYFICIPLNRLPIVGLIVQLGLGIWFGIKGNEWAWKNKKFNNIEAFHEYQKKWAIWSLSIFVLLFILGMLSAMILPGILRSFKIFI